MGRKAQDLTGQVFGNLTVIAREPQNDIHNHVLWRCKCACGKETVVTSSNLRNTTKSCGCMNPKIANANKPIIEKHIKSNRLYKIWDGMHYRCENPKADSYHNYGGRGIKVCEEWTGGEGFDRFREWAVSHGYADDLEIDRIDNDRGYEPSNCRWLSQWENSINRRPRGPSKVAGVYNNGHGAWCAQIKIAGKQNYLGAFKTIEEAIEARKKAEQELGLLNE